MMLMKCYKLVNIIYIILASTAFMVFCHVASAKSPLVLQMRVSHSRNVDQISLIFKKDIVTLVTNSYQISSKDKESVQLGQFQTALTHGLKLFKRQVAAYKKLLGENKVQLDTSQILRVIGSVKTVEPHVPSIYIGGDGKVREVKQGHPYFTPLKDILVKARQKEYKCISCAKYYKKGQFIVRVVQNKSGKSVSRKFSRKQLNCFNLTQKRMECVDDQFGIFEI